MYELPTELCGLKIRSDYRVILDIIEAINDSELNEEEKAMATLQMLYVDWKKIKDYQEAISLAYWFISVGEVGSSTSKPKLMDWQQDFKLIVTSINRVLGKEVRSLDYLHWWTFVGAYYEIGESVFSTIIGIRSKKSKGQKLEKHEQEFYLENKDTIDLKTQYTKEELDEYEQLKNLIDSKIPIREHFKE